MIAPEVAETIVTAAPILLLIALGVLIRRFEIISAQGIEDFKALIVRVALPSAFFVAFLTVEFEAKYLGIFVFVPIVLFALFGIGFLLQRVPARRVPIGRRPTPFLMTGVEFGMLGVGLFGTAYGMSNVWSISVIGLPHELFIWFFYVTVLSATYGSRRSGGEVVVSFLRSPIIIAIVLGTTFNLLGFGDWFTTAIVPRAFIASLEMIATVIAPLILIVVGYGTHVSLRGLAHAAPVVVIRGGLLVIVGAVVAPVIVREILGLPAIFEAAFFTFFILPPPFVIPLYLPRTETTDLQYVNNVLSTHTVFSVVAFLVYFAVT